MQKRSDAAKDTEIVGDLKPKSKEKSRRSVLTYLLALVIVVILVVLLSFAMNRRNKEVEARISEDSVAEYSLPVSGQYTF
jgi:phosphotransferase system  glucose/maltose/N-acetylglucosamine-specific IIC component